MKHLFISFCILLSCFACNKTTKLENPQQDKASVRHQNFTVANWFLCPLQNKNVAIGVVSKHPSKQKMIHNAKAQAAVYLARNRSSFVVSKVAMTSGKDGSYTDKATFDVNVSNDIPTLKKIHKQLKFIDSFDLAGYFVGLFSLQEIQVSKEKFQKKTLREPTWFHIDPILEDSGIRICAQSSSAHFDQAWTDALEKARLKLGGYFAKEVQSMTLQVNEHLKKSIAMETVDKLDHTFVSKVDVDVQYHDNHFRYKVWIEVFNGIND